MSVKMFYFYTARLYVLLFAVLWSLSWPGISQSKLKDELDPNVRDWGDYSDIPPGLEQGLGLDEDSKHGDNRGVGESLSSLAPELDFLTDFAGEKNSLMYLFVCHLSTYSPYYHYR